MEHDVEAVQVSTKSVITNKGDEKNPKVKARFVAREFVSDAIDRDCLFASTFGLCAKRLMLSRAATIQKHNQEPPCIQILDVIGAFLYGWAQRQIYIYIYILFFV